MTPLEAISRAVIFRKLVSPARATELATRLGCERPLVRLPEERSSLSGREDYYCGPDEELNTCEMMRGVGVRRLEDPDTPVEKQLVTPRLIVRRSSTAPRE